jgi:hypothetical protein
MAESENPEGQLLALPSRRSHAIGSLLADMAETQRRRWKAVRMRAVRRPGVNLRSHPALLARQRASLVGAVWPP